jgi:uncharacterized RDD family membrane protein YckC
MRTFCGQETEWLRTLDGVELAPFWRRAIAFAVDWIIVGILTALLFIGGLKLFTRLGAAEGRDISEISVNVGPGSTRVETKDPKLQKFFESQPVHIFNNFVVPILFFGVLLWAGKGRTPGKWLTRIRVVSIVHPHLTFWHAVERALGYGAAALEGGFGFLQYFIHPHRRCAQDRLAETIVVTERSFRAKGLHVPHLPAHEPALCLETADERSA